MQYMLLIYDDPAVLGRMSEEESRAFMGEYMSFTENLRSAGAIVDANRLESADTATLVRVRDGERLVTDGPFAETREALGGYYVVEAESLDEALAHAARIPSARTGTVEVRPVMLVPAQAR
jgi:hypothetical protein